MSLMILKSIYSNEECKQLIQISKTHGVDEPDHYKARGKNASSYNINPKAYGDLLEKFFSLAYAVNLDHFGFDIHTKEYWDINYNKYEANSYYDWHRDTSKNYASDIKLTGIINVSTEPYVGGNLELFLNEEANKIIIENFTVGSIIFFNSPTPHRVTPVIKGVRESLSYWFRGPKWR